MVGNAHPTETQTLKLRNPLIRSGQALKVAALRYIVPPHLNPLPWAKLSLALGEGRVRGSL